MNKIYAIMEDMLKRAKEIDQEGLCLGLFTIQEILEKHLQETTEERECECSEETIDKYEGSFDFTYCPECGGRILRENR